jgi:thiol-disulfide isomerase/thioredoxin
VTRRVAVLLTGLLTALVALAGCSGGLDGTGDANYVVGGGAVTEIALDDREGPVEISGETLQGEPIDLADLRGEVVVMNVWGSWCGPCHAEAPVLQTASEEIDARFVGLSFRESSFDNARSFERRYGITYPTIADEGAGVLALGRYAPRVPPSTYVLDREGRVAAIVLGELTSARTLEALVDQVAAEGGSAG